MDDAEAITMTEQQYTCPKCFKNYTRFTIQEHYACGVEPLETVTKVRMVKSVTVVPSATSIVSGLKDGGDLVVTQNGIVNAPEELEIAPVEVQKPAPKKRGPKPKLKTVA
jgi:hypothetical protein